MIVDCNKSLLLIMVNEIIFSLSLDRVTSYSIILKFTLDEIPKSFSVSELLEYFM